MAANPLVSVIIPMKDSARFLGACMRSIRAQTYAPIEIVVVDNFSTDGTWESVRSIADVAIQVGWERSAQSNAGARLARGAYLYRVDADFVLEPDVVKEAVAACMAGCDAVCVPNRSDASVSFWAAVRHFERRMYDNSEIHTGPRFFRREVFAALGGFDEEVIAGDDYDMNNRLAAAGYRVCHITASERHIGEPSTLGEVARKSFFYGSVFLPFLRKSGIRGLLQVSPLRPEFAMHWREFVRHPVLALGFIVMGSVKYASGAAGLLRGLYLASRSKAAR